MFFTVRSVYYVQGSLKSQAGIHWLGVVNLNPIGLRKKKETHKESDPMVVSVPAGSDGGYWGYLIVRTAYLGDLRTISLYLPLYFEILLRL